MIAVYVILAPGTMGAELALATKGGETLLAHHVQAAQLARLAGPLCVISESEAELKTVHEGFPLEWLHDRLSAPTAWSATRVGLAAVPPGNAALLTPVDALPPRIDTFDLLAEALEHLPEKQIGLRPRMRGKDTFPVILLPQAVSEILAGREDGNLKEWLARASTDGRLLSVDVDDDNVLSGELKGPDMSA